MKTYKYYKTHPITIPNNDRPYAVVVEASWSDSANAPEKIDGTLRDCRRVDPDALLALLSNALPGVSITLHIEAYHQGTYIVATGPDLASAP